MFQQIHTLFSHYPKRFIGIALVCVVGILICTIYLLSQPRMLNGAYLIELREDGFHPSRLVIEEGDTVVFASKTGEAFWPASDVHPTHTAYPEFDPREPVPANETWEFTFTEAGTYGFHDHIVSTFEGEIIVERDDGSRVEVDCSTERTVQCWERLMLATLNEEGVVSALNEIVHLSETEPLFINDCHGYAHLIGEEAYKLYVEDRNFELTPATALCGYGFYHGFMETLLLTTGNIEEAREFCKVVDQKLAGQASAASTACYHGTGHGAVDGSDPTAWGDVEAMMEPGFALCDMLAENDFQMYLCETGVFNAIEILSADPKYEIAYLREDPFAMCNKQPLSRREGCYSNMLPILLQNTNNDVAEAAAYINEHMIDHDAPAIDGHTVNELTTIGLMFEYIRINGETEGYQERGIEFCRTQPTEDQLACIKGISGGHIKYGEPGVEYVRGLEFCANSLLTAAEEDACYAYLLTHLSSRYTPEKTQEICSTVAVEYRKKYCPF